MITLDKLVELAREGLKHSDTSGHETLDKTLGGIIDLLAEAAPCGWGGLIVCGDGTISVPNSWAAPVTAEDARHMARMLLRAADEAEK